MIVITGAAGFIGSNLVRDLNDSGFKDLILVDNFANCRKEKNYKSKIYKSLVDRNDFFDWLDKNHKFVQFIFHIGARTNTAEFDKTLLDRLNTDYSKTIFRKACEYGIPIIYASSAATYGDGKNGFSDSTQPEELIPLNPYGDSKNEFDKWVLKQENVKIFWAGFKFFNVYGPNEYHKDRMASVIMHAYNQIIKENKLDLFRSHKPDYKDGGQLRDFIYVKELTKVLMFFMHQRHKSGIYNLGTGKARSFYDLGKSVFDALKKPLIINYIDIPIDIRDKYQYFTEADMTKLRESGYVANFQSLESGVFDYVDQYLRHTKYR